MTTLTVRDLAVEIAGSRVLDGVGFELGPGERVGLLGASGSGKSLTVAAVLGRLPAGARATGSVQLAGTEVLGVPAARRRHDTRVAAVFHDPLASLNPLVRVAVQLGEPLRRHRRLSRAAAREAAAGLLVSVGFTEPGQVLDSYPGELSGGQRQRVCIAIAVACRRNLLLADEPTTALDVVTQAQVLDVLRAQTADGSSALLFVTHDFTAAAALCDRALVLAGGRIVESAPMAELLTTPRHEYTRALVRAARAGSIGAALADARLRAGSVAAAR
ncbi:ABC transporter ATP-binding protein [Pseudonocardia sp. H11422]|uniref:ABC transporter ATP-binding protein n=1 Tax=Pseudonocardia sp. H11422 TaxID=2835866 RepID=UPI0027E27A4A|nr:ABC transporter ATP-binding protein [Pseudonocardia sp. H11422]